MRSATVVPACRGQPRSPRLAVSMAPIRQPTLPALSSSVSQPEVQTMVCAPENVGRIEEGHDHQRTDWGRQRQWPGYFVIAGSPLRSPGARRAGRRDTRDAIDECRRQAARSDSTPGSARARRQADESTSRETKNASASIAAQSFCSVDYRRPVVTDLGRLFGEAGGERRISSDDRSVAVDVTCAPIVFGDGLAVDRDRKPLAGASTPRRKLSQAVCSVDLPWPPHHRIARFSTM